MNEITVRLDGMDKNIEEMDHSQQFISTQYVSPYLLALTKTQTQLKLEIFIGMSAKLIANGHAQIYKYTEYGQ